MTTEPGERTPQQACAAVLADVAAGAATLTDAHSRLRKVRRRPLVTTAAVLEQAPDADGIDVADAAALVGASTGAAFTALTAEQVAALQTVVASGGLRLPYRTFPWSPPPPDIAHRHSSRHTDAGGAPF